MLSFHIRTVRSVTRLATNRFACKWHATFNAESDMWIAYTQSDAVTTQFSESRFRLEGEKRSRSRHLHESAFTCKWTCLGGAGEQACNRTSAIRTFNSSRVLCYLRICMQTRYQQFRYETVLNTHRRPVNPMGHEQLHIGIMGSWDVATCNMAQMCTKVLEEPAASIFRAETQNECRLFLRKVGTI